MKTPIAAATLYCAKRRYASLFLLLLLWLPSVAYAQSITIVLHQPPPNRLRVSDLWMIDLFNPGKTAIKVYLHGTATEVSIPSRPINVVDAQSTPFLLQPGFHRVTGTDISPIKVNTSDPVYRNIVTTTGNVPSGDYDICVEVKDAATDVRLGIDCITQTVENLTPPILVAPFNGSVVLDRLPVFTWTPPAPTNGIRPEYRLKIVEVLGQQSPFDAMQSNFSWFAASRIQQTLFQYPLASRAFVAGHHYAWKIDAFSSNTSRPFLLGESEVWDFTYQPVTDGQAGVGALTGADLATGSTGAFGDSARQLDFWNSFITDNFYIPYNSINLVPSTVALDQSALGDPTLYDDPNAHGFTRVDPNDTSHAGDCGRSPSVTIALDYPSVNAIPANWSRPFSIDWSVLHSAQLDHVDLQIALWGHEEAPLAHFLYRASQGSIASATTFDPRPFILNNAAGGIACVISVVAIDVDGHSSGKVRKLYLAGNFAVPAPTLGPDALGSANFTPPLAAASTVTIVGNDNSSSHVTSLFPPTIVAHAGSDLTIINRDSRPHHYRSVYSPPYPEASGLTIGGVPVLDATEIPPGASSTLHLPSAAACYQWTLFDEDDSGDTFSHALIIRIASH